MNGKEGTHFGGIIRGPLTPSVRNDPVLPQEPVSSCHLEIWKPNWITKTNAE